jgi:hypothetical protein
MAVHDAYARITPFELILPSAAFADERFPRVREEADKRGLGLSDPGSFALLSEVGVILREIRGEGEDPRLIHQHGALLFHSFHFWTAARPVFLLERGVVRHITGAGPEESGWEARLPGKAGYVQLPHHLVWARGGEDDPPESLDGFFWSAPSEESLSLLVVLGVRKDRPGFTVVPLPTIPLSAAVPWASLQVREEGGDFSSDLPGAELEGLYSVGAGAEVLKLAMRAFWYLDSFPSSIVEAVDPGAADETAPEGPPPSALAYRRVTSHPDGPPTES